MPMLEQDQDNQGYCQKLITRILCGIYSLYVCVTGNVKVEIVVRVCDVNLHFWPESALLHSFQHVYENNLCWEQIFFECDFYFQCFNYNISKPVTQHYYTWLDYFI